MIGALKAYPDQAWYDPNRPVWLPYVIDSFTESARKYSVLLTGNPSSGSAADVNSTQPQDPTPFYVGAAVAALFGVVLLIRSLRR